MLEILSGINKVTGTLNDFLNNASGIAKNIVSPGDAYGYGGYEFDVIDEEQTKFESEITDHYVEDNTAVQDDIALKPIEVTAKGFVGEFVYNTPVLESLIQGISTKLGIVSQLTPKYSSQAQKLMQKAQKISNTAENLMKKVNNIKNVFTGLIGDIDSKQTEAYMYFYSAWQSRQLFKIQTPYCFWENMAIKQIKFIQTGETNSKSQIEITFKQIRITKTTDDTSDNSQGRRIAQVSNRVNAGLIKGKETILKSIKSWWG